MRPVSLPEGAVPRRVPISPVVAGWSEIELMTPTAEVPVGGSMPFSPACGIPENGTCCYASHGSPRSQSAPVCSATSEDSCRAPDEEEQEPESGGPPTHLMFKPATLGSLLLNAVAGSSPHACTRDAGEFRLPLNPFEGDQGSPVLGGGGRFSSLSPGRRIRDCSSLTTASGQLPPLIPSPTAVDKRSTHVVDYPPESSLEYPPSSHNNQHHHSDLTPAAWKRVLSLRSVWRNSHPEPPPCKAMTSGSAKMWTQPFCKAVLKRLHPLQLLLGLRVFLLYPVFFLFLINALLSEDWRHVQISYAAATNIKSRTLLSLRTVQRLTETVTTDMAAAAAASVRELPIAYARISKSTPDTSFCDAPMQTAAAEKLLGSLTLSQMLDPLYDPMSSNPRVSRLALYHLLHGPTFRDVDCRALRVFQHAGQVTFAFLVLAAVFVLVEWTVLSFHLFSARHAAEMVQALSFFSQQKRIAAAPADMRKRAETDPAILEVDDQSPPFLCPRIDSQQPPDSRERELSWALIELSGRHTQPPDRSHAHNARQGSSPRASSFATGIERVFRRIRYKIRGGHPEAQSDASSVTWCGLFKGARDTHESRPRVCVLDAPEGQTRRQQLRVSEWLWWRPLWKVQRCVGWQAGAPRSVRANFFCASAMAGSTLLLSCATLACLSVATVVWTRNTSRPACLNEETELQVCSAGVGFHSLIFSLLAAVGCLYLHWKSSEICQKLSPVK